MTRERLSILLLQIREDPRVRREEHESFARYARVRAEQIHVHNVFDDPRPAPSLLRGYDAVLVGGASEASVLEPGRYPFVPHAQALLLECVARDIPTFASCFGFQLAALALGGEVERDQSDFEMGTLRIQLSDAARGDPLFRDTPREFLAVSVHREFSPQAPVGTRLLARTERCCHSFRVPKSRFWAFQFHPEVDRQRLVERLTIFKQHYTNGDEQLERVLMAAQETPESNALLRKFGDRVLLAGDR